MMLHDTVAVTVIVNKASRNTAHLYIDSHGFDLVGYGEM